MPPTTLIALVALIPIVGTLLLGVQVKLDYLSEVVKRPRALLVGLAGQLLLLPLLAIVFLSVYPAPLGVKGGAFVLAAMPGGPLSNMVTFWGRGRLPLSVVLTACSTVTSVITVPLWVSLGLRLVDGGAVHGPSVAPIAARAFAILVVPLALGMAVGGWKPAFAERLEQPTRRAMLVLIVIVLSVYVAIRWTFILAAFTPAVFTGVVVFHAVAVLVSWTLARRSGLDRRDSFTIGIEVGTQNIVIGFVVVELIDRPDLLPFLGFYGLVALVMAALWVRLLGERPQLGAEAIGQPWAGRAV